MKKGVEILKEIYFCSDEETAKVMNMQYSSTWSFIQILIDYDNQEIRTFKRSNWNSSYNVTEVTKF